MIWDPKDISAPAEASPLCCPAAVAQCFQSDIFKILKIQHQLQENLLLRANSWYHSQFQIGLLQDLVQNHQIMVDSRQIFVFLRGLEKLYLLKSESCARALFLKWSKNLCTLWKSIPTSWCVLRKGGCPSYFPTAVMRHHHQDALPGILVSEVSPRPSQQGEQQCAHRQDTGAVAESLDLIHK